MATVPLTNDWSSYSKLNAELESLLPTLGGFQMVTPTTTLESMRALSASRPPSALWPEVLENDIQIPVRDGTWNAARVYSPSISNQGSKGRALFVFIYGGGYVVGSITSEETNARNWVKRFGGVAINISYRHAPEHQWPGPQEDIYDATKWITANYEDFDVDPTKGFFLGGVSAGATAAITVSHQFRDEGVFPPLTGLYLAVPGPCRIAELPEKYRSREKSWEQNKDAPIFNKVVSDFLASFVHPPPLDPLRSPLLWKTGHKDLPPAYFVIAGADRSRDCGLIYEEILREEYGIKTKVTIFAGLPHSFWGIFPKADFTREYWETTANGFRWLLDQ